MAPAGLLEAVHQRLLVRLEEEHPQVQAVLVELADHGLKLVEVLASSHVGDDRGVADHRALVAEELAQRPDHPRRQVVDAEEARVLERGDRLRLARARIAGDHPQLDGLREQLGLRASSGLVELAVDVARDLARYARDGLDLLARGGDDPLG